VVGGGEQKLAPKVSTVVNKIGTVSNEYRVFDMELIAGKPDFQCELREHGIRFKFDFSRVTHRPAPPPPRPAPALPPALPRALPPALPCPALPLRCAALR
jgi:hypothetical protein